MLLLFRLNFVVVLLFVLLFVFLLLLIIVTVNFIDHVTAAAALAETTIEAAGDYPAEPLGSSELAKLA